VVTNLDRATSERAVLSIGAEVARRQSILNDLTSAGTISSANVSSLWETDPALAREHGLPILVIVVDEFNRFIEEVPELVTELLAVTQQGRSLGIHLVLAMQQVPQSSTMTKLLANISLRIVLRTAPGESRVILSNDDADEIPKSAIGRGLVRVGEPPRIVAFQTGFLGGRPGETSGTPAAAIRSWGAPGPAVVEEHRLDETDLSATTHAIIKAASGISLPPSPLQPPLPEQLPLSDLTGYDRPTWGVIDRPDATRLEDRLLPLTADPDELGNLGIIASSTFGRTTALASLALAMAQRLTPDALHVHAIDVTNSGLRDLDFLPHAGTIAVRDVDRTYRLIDHLSAELDRRLARPDEPRPLQLLLVDTWEAVLEQYEPHSDAVQQLLALAREGPRVGMVLAAAGEARLLNPPLASLLSQRLVLTLLDTTHYALAGMRAPDRPAPPGRGRLVSTEAGEVQVALPDGGIEVAARKVAERWNDHDHVHPPVRLRSLPGLLHVDDLPTVADDGPLHVRFALGGQDVGPIGVDFATEGPAVPVVGPRGSGRTTLLWSAARTAANTGVPFLVVAPMVGSPLDGADGLPHCLGVFDGRDDDALIAALEAATGPLLLLVDDAPRLIGTRADDVLRAFVGARGLGQVGALVATDPDGAEGARSGILAEARRAGSGVIFAPSNLTARLVGLSGLPEHLVGRQGPGRALLSRGGRPIAIQVAA
jgi:DNA segregation ATPase FtsK/SpoIIIE, S-DNA-T family